MGMLHSSSEPEVAATTTRRLLTANGKGQTDDQMWEIDSYGKMLLLCALGLWP